MALVLPDLYAVAALVDGGDETCAASAVVEAAPKTNDDSAALDGCVLSVGVALAGAGNGVGLVAVAGQASEEDDDTAQQQLGLGDCGLVGCCQVCPWYLGTGVALDRTNFLDPALNPVVGAYEAAVEKAHSWSVVDGVEVGGLRVMLDQHLEEEGVVVVSPMKDQIVDETAKLLW